MRWEDLERAFSSVSAAADKAGITYLGSVDPSSGSKADGVAKSEDEDKDDAGVVRGAVFIAGESLW